MTSLTTATDRGFFIWLDPGKTTGVACYQLYAARFKSFQGDFNEVGDEVEVMLDVESGNAAIGWEQYLVTKGRAGTASYSLEMIGVLKRLAYVHHAVVLPAMPSSARKLGDDPKLRALGWYKPGLRHANDAANHLLAYLLRERMLPASMQARLADSLWTSEATSG